eukprot:scaffold341173_cov45-Prasinocladus_malaysianus.AAC.1
MRAEREDLQSCGSDIKTPQASGNKLSVISANARVARVLAEFIPRQRLTPAKVDKLVGWFKAETRVEPKVLYGKFAILLGMASG